jgi:outer membrane protein
MLMMALLLAMPHPAHAAPERLTLDHALALARDHQPQLQQARAALRAAEARTLTARAPMLPQVSMSAGYSLGSRRETLGIAGSNLNLRANQLLFDFGQRESRYQASNAQLAAQGQSERDTRQAVALGVRTSFFAAQAAKILLEVNREALANQERHLKQAEQFVKAGTRAPIDVVQERANVANARRQLINAENDYRTSKARLNQAMGREGGLDFEVAPEAMPVVAGEDLTLDALMQEAEANRPDLARMAEQVRSQELALAAQSRAQSPTLQASTGLGDNGLLIGRPGTSWEVGLSFSWPLYSGGSIQAQTQEAEASLEGTRAQAIALRQQVRLDLTEATLAITSQKAAIRSAQEAASNAAERLKLAEGRYAAGVGNIIELADAQLALTSARSQVVQEEFRLATARAQLLKALGRE